MTEGEVRAVLARRLAHNPNAERWNAAELRLTPAVGFPLGVLLTEDGWTCAEIDATPGLRACSDSHGWDAALCLVAAHWAAEWQLQDDAALALKMEGERKRALAKQRQAAEEEKQWQATKQRRWCESGVPDGLRAEAALAQERAFFTTSPDRAHALDRIRNYPWVAEENDDMSEYLNMALIGPPGTGKSLLSAIWLRDRMQVDGETGRFVDARMLSRRLAHLSKRDAAIAEFAEPDNLVIDDVLAELEVDGTADAISAMVELLNVRSAHRRPTCFSTNQSPDTLRERFLPRGFSRLMHGALLIVLDGVDWRISGGK